MENNYPLIESNCGPQPEGVLYSSPGNDPNFIFTPDPLFESLTLYDTEGNIINVNSWTECAHYINGGWSSNLVTFVPGDKYIFYGLTVLCLLILVVKIIKTKSEK